MSHRGKVGHPPAYKLLISPQRLRPSSQEGRDLETEMLSDHGRIVTSSAFRRLQTKAQVFSLEQNAAVRSRLTHTIEVSMYGGLVARKVCTDPAARALLPPELWDPFVKTVENACLLHDFGNPPFGHLGEDAIRGWCKRRRGEIESVWKSGGLDAAVIGRFLPDFLEFDGNAQGLRIITRLQWLDDEYGLNLTCTLLASTIKYPSRDPKKVKVSYFETERDIVAKIWGHLGLRVSADAAPAQRHPLTLVMEAADDIAYCISDIEDAIEKQIITSDLFFGELPDDVAEVLPEAAKKCIPGPDVPRVETEAKNAPFVRFKIALARELVDTAARQFIEQHGAILNGEFEGALLPKSTFGEKVTVWLKNFSMKHIFMSREAVSVELSGFNAIQGLLDGFWPLLALGHSQFESLSPGSKNAAEGRAFALERRLHSLLPNKHILAYQHAAKACPDLEPVYRLHLVVDYISGMTDSHALKVFQMLKGITPGLSP